MMRDLPPTRVLLWLTALLPQFGCPQCEPLPEPVVDAPFTWGVYTNQGIVEIDDTGEVPWQWGFQGGTMIRPVLLFPTDGPVAPDDEVVVRVWHEPDPAAPETFRVPSAFTYQEFGVYAYEEQGRIWVGPLDDQLGNESLTGIQLRLIVQLSFDAQRYVKTLHITAPDRDPTVDPCLPYAPGLGESGGCLYAEVPVQMTLTEVAANPNLGACDTDAADLMATFQPADDDARACFAAAGYDRLIADDQTPVPVAHAPAALDCLTEEGVVVGEQRTGTYTFIVQGTCSPDLSLSWSDMPAICRCE